MPEIEITEDQRDRLRAVQEALEADVVGKYGHVRASDAVEYLLDRYEADPEAGTPDAGGGASDGDGSEGTSDGADDDGGASGEDDDGDGGEAAVTGGDDAELDAMMSLLEDHDDKWSEAEGSEARYEVELPDGTTESARTKDDVRGLLFEHYR
ncbi:MAG: hypothetical protein ABEH40_07785 [Haloferacaceae archaeon]